MARDKNEYFRKLRKTGDQHTTASDRVVVEVLVDILDVMDAVLVKLEEVRETIENK